MRSFKRELLFAGTLAAVAISPTWSASHLWVIQEVFSNADGTIQFVEMWTPGQSETFIGGKSVHTDANSSDPFPGNLTGPTNDRHLLLATPAFVALPGAPTPDLIIAPNFFDINGDTIQWHTYPASILSFGPGELPTDGVQSLDRDGIVGPATPTNFAGDTFAPPGVSGLEVAKILPVFPDASRVSLTWNAESCLGGGQHHIVYGFGAGLPDALGGVYVLGPALSGQCAIAGSPMVWSGVPNPADDEKRLLWFLMLADDGSVEGSWGKDSPGNERTGPVGGASGQCGITVKNVANPCE